MTLPTSSGWTRTSSIRPRRRSRSLTTTSSGFDTMPRTRCSSASASTSGLLGRIVAARDGLLGRGLGLSCSLGLAAGLGDGLGGGGTVALGQRPVEGGGLVLGLGLGIDAGRRLVARERLPVAGALDQCNDGLGRLSADPEPVLCPLGVDADHRRVVLRVVEPDLFDRPAIALVARVHDDDAVVR